MYCRPDNTVSACIALPGGAADGTTCDTGKICLNGVCIASELGSNDPCPFGDGLVTQNLLRGGLTLPGGSTQITCAAAFTLISQASQSVSAYCLFVDFRFACCQSCKSKRTCRQKFLNLEGFKIFFCSQDTKH